MASSHHVALITGASSGFGRATAALLAAHGYALVLIARREERLHALQKELSVPVYVKSLDIRNRNEVEAFFQTLPDAFSPIDVLVNNAGLALGLTPAQDAQLDDWEGMVDTNVKGLLYVTRCVLEKMKQQNRGIIINIGSVTGEVPYKGGNVYGATKAFVSQFSRNLRTDLFGTNIKVTNLEPGAAETEFSLVRFKGDAARAKSVYERSTPLTAQDIAETILWIIQRPGHVNIDSIRIMPLDQTWNGLVMNKK
ncbi:MAG: SDR family NAD(P)-dependent oxidoreductase [Patescibacteria group bacterium]